MSWELLFLVVLVLWLYVGRFYIPTYWYYLSPTKRRAMRLAVQFARDRDQMKVDWSGCWVERRDPQKCFVFLQHRSALQPPSYSVFVVWRESGRIDDLGSWQFHWGLFRPSQPIEAYEQCLATGVPWPVGVCEWVERSKEFESSLGCNSTATANCQDKSRDAH
jgi:hypothetical protein